MKKKLILLFILLFIPFIVKAEVITKYYDLCENGCNYLGTRRSYKKTC